MTQQLIVGLIVAAAALYAVWRWMPAGWRRGAAQKLAAGTHRAGWVDEARAKELAAEVKSAEADQADAEETWRAALMEIPNLASDETPAGGEDDFIVLETVGTPPEFDFEPRDHVELGRMLGAIDLERGAKVSGSRFYFLTGIGAQLE